MGKQAWRTRQYMSIRAYFPTPHGAARVFFNCLFGSSSYPARIAAQDKGIPPRGGTHYIPAQD